MARYLDLEGLQFFYTNLKRVFRTEAQVEYQITSALNTLKGSAVEVIEAANWSTATATPATGVTYIKHTVVNAGESNERNDYEAYVYNGTSLVPLTSLGQVATLDADGKISPNTLPDLAITDVLPSIADQTAFATFKTTNPDPNKVGDIVIVADDDGNGNAATYIITGVDSTTDPNVPTYTLSKITPAHVVTSVANKTGDVELVAADITDLEALDVKEIDSLFIGTNEIWIKAPAAWTALDVQVESAGTATALTAASNSDYFVFDTSDVSNAADQLVFSNTAGAATLALDGVDTKAKIQALAGHIIVITASSDEFSVFPEIPQA